jgi:hypothetical protein
VKYSILRNSLQRPLQFFPSSSAAISLSKFHREELERKMRRKDSLGRMILFALIGHYLTAFPTFHSAVETTILNVTIERWNVLSMGSIRVVAKTEFRFDFDFFWHEDGQDSKKMLSGNRFV